MKMNFRLLLTFVLALLVLTACNTADPQTEPASDTITADDSKIKDSVETDNPPITNEEEPTNDGNGQSITYTSNDKEHTEKTTSIDSELYTIQAIPGFSLTAEEPGRDVLFLEKDDAIFMRIEPMSVNDTTFENIVTNTEETMKAISEQYEAFDLTPYVKAGQYKNSTAYMANLGEEEVIMVVLEKDEFIYRLSIYDKTSHDLSDAMMKMGLTITAK
ncbi:hypothetical protein [Lysinibacillus antri]|uniref:Lipoprotein n=1 Tax=Lysinibacillus antri TaxID=2498145 RepID=A0A3S0WFZ1_9BACI|nr:hypothetical protein [Lysinibacillus antri]RUL51846.1 hypothetical protein EK386_10905 [Lysinibacillus antri]